MKARIAATKLKVSFKTLTEALLALDIKNTKPDTELDEDTIELLTEVLQGQKDKEHISEPDQAAVPKDMITVNGAMTVKELATVLDRKPNEIISKLISMGVFATINKTLSVEECMKVGKEFKRSITYEEPPQKDKKKNIKIKSKKHKKIDKEGTVRPPVVTFMGHVDHGKTSLLDKIRHARVALSEHGGITQHIGAYKVQTPKGEITFLDTPGHEAFTAIRARGASVTDIVILVVAADDGIMPQTREAINHCKAAEVPVIVAINKTDLQRAQPDMVKKQLSEVGLATEDWGGETISVLVSAMTGKGIDELLEMILLQTEIMELTANQTVPAKGVVIESKLCKNRGPVATFLIQEGTLRVGDPVVCGPYCTKVKAIVDHAGRNVKMALPSDPVEIMGLSGVPEAGDMFEVVDSEKTAKAEAQKRVEEIKNARQLERPNNITLDDFYHQLSAGSVKELTLILKADVHGSLEAIEGVIGKIQSDKVSLKILHSAVGDITESDIMLASASKAVLIGFNIKPSAKVKDTAKKEGVEIRTYSIIYELSSELVKAMQGLLDPEEKKVVTGSAQVRETFSISKLGTIAGCVVTQGTITRSSRIRVIRGEDVLFDGSIASLKRFKDEVKEVKANLECGIKIQGFNDVESGDILEAYITEKVTQLL